LLAFDATTRVAYVEAQPYGDITSGHATIMAVALGTGDVTVRRTLGRHFADVIVLRPRP
jgi:hypothetical protein